MAQSKAYRYIDFLCVIVYIMIVECVRYNARLSLGILYRLVSIKVVMRRDKDGHYRKSRKDTSELC